MKASLTPHSVDTTPKVSILIPTHNRERFILGAVRSALAQTYGNIEVLVGVNGCTDGTERLVGQLSDPRLQVIVRPILKTMYENFNLLIEEASGEFVLILSDDDEVFPDAIANLMATMQQAGTRMACGAAKVTLHGVGELPPCFDIAGERADWLTVIERYLSFKLAIYPCATVLPRAELQALGGYDDCEYHFAADTAVWMLLARQLGHIALSHAVVANYTVHDANETIVASQGKWLSALEGIGKVVDRLSYPCSDQRGRIQRAFELYRARSIVRTQSDAVGRSGFALGDVMASGRIVVRETHRLPPGTRIRLVLRWLARSALQAVRLRRMRQLA